jgi:hypothetical protein
LNEGREAGPSQLKEELTSGLASGLASVPEVSTKKADRPDGGEATTRGSEGGAQLMID